MPAWTSRPMVCATKRLDEAEQALPMLRAMDAGEVEGQQVPPEEKPVPEVRAQPAAREASEAQPAASEAQPAAARVAQAQRVAAAAQLAALAAARAARAASAAQPEAREAALAAREEAARPTAARSSTHLPIAARPVRPPKNCAATSAYPKRIPRPAARKPPAQRVFFPMRPRRVTRPGNAPLAHARPGLPTATPPIPRTVAKRTCRRSTRAARAPTSARRARRSAPGRAGRTNA